MAIWRSLKQLVPSGVPIQDLESRPVTPPRSGQGTGLMMDLQSLTLGSIWALRTTLGPQDHPKGGPSLRQRPRGEQRVSLQGEGT